MSEPLHKFPPTPHLVWLGGATVRDDKVLSASEADAFLSGFILVEEKVDGSNLGLSFDGEGRLQFQNRGNWLTGKLTGQWERLRAWAADREARLRECLPTGHVLFGEWCYAAHSIRYDGLPDWFVVFDVLDTGAQRFWSGSRRDALALGAGLATVPRVAVGRFALPEIIAMLNGRSAYATAQSREGLYLRREAGDWLVDRAKVVRAEFCQAITEHWSKQPLIVNTLAYAGHGSKEMLPIVAKLRQAN